jgi:hypothetical protein
LIDDTLLLGGGGYWLANGSDIREMAYGGVLAEYMVKPTRFMSLSARGLFGFGTTTLPVSVLVPVRGSRGGSPSTVRRFYPIYDDFVLAEPQGNVVFNVSSWMRLGLGASYRFVGWTSFGDRIGGVSGNFSVVLGSF